MRDTRHLPYAALETLRCRGVAMVCGGMTQAATARALGVHKNTVSLWVKWWRAGGDIALKPKPRGKSDLSALTEAAIKRLIIDKYPDQLNLPSALWTRHLVHTLIATRLDIALDYITTVRVLRGWGVIPQRPVERRDPEIRVRLRHKYPEIMARAQAERAQIQWARVTPISPQAGPGFALAHQGQTSTAARASQGQTCTMVSSAPSFGQVRFMLHEGTVNPTLFRTFLERLIRDAGRKIFLIVDNIEVDHDREVTTWLDANHQKIELFHLPTHRGARSGRDPSSAVA